MVPILSVVSKTAEAHVAVGVPIANDWYARYQPDGTSAQSGSNTKSISKGYRACPHPQPLYLKDREIDRKPLDARHRGEARVVSHSNSQTRI